MRTLRWKAKIEYYFIQYNILQFNIIARILYASCYFITLPVSDTQKSMDLHPLASNSPGHNTWSFEQTRGHVAGHAFPSLPFLLLPLTHWPSVSHPISSVIGQYTCLGRQWRGQNVGHGLPRMSVFSLIFILQTFGLVAQSCPSFGAGHKISSDWHIGCCTVGQDIIARKIHILDWCNALFV